MRARCFRSIASAALLSACAAAMLSACEKSKPPASADGGVDFAGTSKASCLDQPNTLPRPPQGGLPCELVPPGLTLP